MTLDLVTSQRLVEPTPWEMESYRAAPKHERDDWHDVLDRAAAFRWDDSVLRVVESEARREELARRLWCMPAVAMCGGPRPNVFRALFQKDIGGVAGVSDSWFDASYYVVDGVSGKVSDFVDYVDPSHTLRQATSANQVAAPSADAALANALTATFSGSQWYTSTRSASSWTYLHDGTGFEATTVLTPTSTPALQAVWATRTGGGVVVGCQHYFAGTTLSMAVGNGTANIFGPNPTTSAGQVSAGSSTYFTASYSEGSSPEGSIRKNGTVVASGASLAAPSASAAASTLRFGAFSDGSPLNARVRSKCFFRRVLSAAHRTIVQQWIQRETGLSP